MDFLSALIILPTIGAFLVLLLAKAEPLVKLSALAISIVTLLLAIVCWYNFDPNVADLQLEAQYLWAEGYNINFSVGVDGFSIYFILLTALLIPICIIASWSNIKHNVARYMSLFLLLEAIVMGVFVVNDLLLFYVFFEASLMPLFLIIGIWGGENRFYASFKFFLYTFVGSVFMLLAIIYIYVNTGTTNLIELYSIVPGYTLDVQKFLWLAFFVSFAVKIPMWPVHTWLPDTHVQAPTAGSVILAGILLKLGGYGFIRVLIPMLPEASVYFSSYVVALGVTAVVYTSLVALMQTDMKKLIAYSSIAHMGYVTAGIFSFNEYGIQGGVFQMLSHGVVSAALFLCIGVLYDRCHTRQIKDYSGLTALTPKFALVFMLFTLSSVGLPGTSGFIGEILSMLGTFKYNVYAGIAIAFGMVLGAAYMLWLYRRVMFGEVHFVNAGSIGDLNKIEFINLWILGVATVLLGIYPKIVTNYVEPTAASLIGHVSGSLGIK